MKNYMLAVHYVEGADVPGEEEMMAAFAAVEAYNDRLKEANRWVFACGLEAPSTSTVVDNTGDQLLTTDGPFSEAKEQIGGFWVIRSRDLDEALKWAAEASTACANPVEVRPLQDDDDYAGDDDDEPDGAHG